MDKSIGFAWSAPGYDCAFGTWRSLVSALVWGTRGRRFKSGRPDSERKTAMIDKRVRRAVVTNRVLTVPNVLSAIRLATVPVFLYLFVSGREEAAVILYGASA